MLLGPTPRHEPAEPVHELRGRLEAEIALGVGDAPDPLRHEGSAGRLVLDRQGRPGEPEQTLYQCPDSRADPAADVIVDGRTRRSLPRARWPGDILDKDTKSYVCEPSP